MTPDGPLARTLRRTLVRALQPGARLAGLRVIHAERLPRPSTPTLFTCNHAAFVDTLWLRLAVPIDAPVCGAKPRLFSTRARRALMGLADVRRVDDEAMFTQTATALLRHGTSTWVYPEMGRNPQGLGAFKPWAATVAIAVGAPLLPCYLRGTTQGESGPPTLFVGEILAPRGDAAHLTTALRAATIALRDESRATRRG